MRSRWNDQDAQALNNDLLQLRVYTSRLIGQEEDLVMHGGGNTSVKIRETNLFGEMEDLLYVKGSGWNLGTIEAPGFAPVRLQTLQQMAKLDTLSDPDMVKYQRAAMTNPFAPNPSVEAILHAIIPFTFVDHTHADAVVTITNTPSGEQRIKAIYDDRVLIIPYVMPGFILAKTIHQMTQGFDWNSIEALILMNHGVFTFHKDPKVSYENMIRIVSEAEDYLKAQGAVPVADAPPGQADPAQIAQIRQAVGQHWGQPVLARFNGSPATRHFTDHHATKSFANRGPITPDHIIRTKRIPVLLEGEPKQAIDQFVKQYQDYYNTYNDGSQQMLDPAPRWAVWPGHGTLSFGTTSKAITIISDISRHTMKAIQQAEHLEAWQPLPQKELFEMEYWVLEQAKLKKGGSPPPMQGKVALVSGAASGIGKACVEQLVAEGAVVVALDINPAIRDCFDPKSVLGVVCDLTQNDAIEAALTKAVLHFGGIDLLVSNAGIFPQSQAIAELDAELWSRSLDINLTSHQRLLHRCIPYLEQGFDPAVVIIGSKNVPAPGPGASAYSVAKAGLTQLARIAALELGKKGIRVNIIHPNAVYDTAIWTEEVLQARAEHYGLSIEAYKTNNVLKTEVTSKDVANLTVQLLGPAFGKITGAQIPIDGGNDRVI
ncbi:MAG: bifunctional aldolase/short-chain dehydrogenase [Bacteroidota bacterium]